MQPYAILLSLDARDDLREIEAYLKPRNPAATKVALVTLFTSINTLSFFPQMGRIAEESPGIRKLLSGNYWIYYKSKPMRRILEVHRIYDTRRDPRSAKR